MAALTTAPEPAREVVRGWGRGEGASMLVLRPGDLEQLRCALALARAAGRDHDGGRYVGAIARGMGRSYGDAAQLKRGFALDMTRLARFQLDPDHVVVTAWAGATIGDLLRQLVPAGWMLPVVPGTQHVTVGGAIASDIHGKNHGTAGTIGSHVRSLGLLTAAGELLELSPEDELFRATIGGMGLTGVILWARIALRRVSSALLSVDTDRVGSLEEALAALAASGGSYRVAWLDLLGPRPGRAIVTRAEHLDAPEASAAARASATVKARAAIPQRWPSGLLRPALVQAFNDLRFRRAPRRERGQVQSIGSHMFPLDALDAWPRLYGAHGFMQYQLAVPVEGAHVLDAVIERLRRAHVACFLAVLKDFGPPNAAPLSFPIEGWTLTLDLPRAADGLDAALDECDRLVGEAGGRVYLTKDARLSPEMVRAMYPRLSEWQAIRDRVDPDDLWRSDLALRTGLVSPEAR